MDWLRVCTDRPFYDNQVRRYMYLRYIIKDEDGAVIRKLAERYECDPYLSGGCTLTVLPKIKKPTDRDKYLGALELVGEAPF